MSAPRLAPLRRRGPRHNRKVRRLRRARIDAMWLRAGVLTPEEVRRSRYPTICLISGGGDGGVRGTHFSAAIGTWKTSAKKGELATLEITP